MVKFLIYGNKGWIGSYFSKFVQENYPRIELLFTETRVDNIADVKQDLTSLKPDRVVSFIGRTSG